MLSGTLLAVGSAACYGVGGVAISKAPRSGDGGVLLAALVTALFASGLWAAAGSVSVSDISLKGAAWFALSGILATALGRQMMYAATALIGAVGAGVYRRLILLFALPAALVLLGQWPSGMALLGGAVILGGVLLYARVPLGTPSRRGVLLGIGSALAYALAYCARSLGLQTVPDPALGTLIGAIVAALWLIAAQRGILLKDRSRWHWIAAAALSLGQTLQFFALAAAPVAIVAVIGTLEVLFAALLVHYVFRSETVDLGRLILSIGLAAIGTALMLL